MQDKASQLGITSESISETLNGIVGGTNITQIRDSIYLVDVVGRANDSDRTSIEALQNLQIQNKDGKSFPLAAIACLRYELEQPTVWRRHRLPTITIKASLALIPIAREIFWGPMAYAMMGGIIIGTILTLLFLPALYVAWFRIQEPSKSDRDPIPESNASRR